MKLQQVLTHKGWFGLCPVYIGDIDSEEPFLEPRHWSLGWLLDLSGAMYQGIMFVMDVMGAYPPGFPIRITGRLKKEKVITLEVKA